MEKCQCKNASGKLAGNESHQETGELKIIMGGYCYCICQ